MPNLHVFQINRERHVCNCDYCAGYTYMMPIKTNSDAEDFIKKLRFAASQPGTIIRLSNISQSFGFLNKGDFIGPNKEFIAPKLIATYELKE